MNGKLARRIRRVVRDTSPQLSESKYEQLMVDQDKLVTFLNPDGSSARKIVREEGVGKTVSLTDGLRRRVAHIKSGVRDARRARRTK